MNYKSKGNSKHGRSAELMRKLKYELSFDAAEELVRLYRLSKKLPEKIKIAESMMSYQYPKLKAMELAAAQGDSVTFNIDLSGNGNKVVDTIEDIQQDASNHEETA